MPTKIKSDYKPSPRVYELLKAYGVQNPIEFVGHELPAFMMYWEGTGKTKADWNSTCLNWMKRTYEDKKHQMAQNRSYSGQQGDDLFSLALQKVESIGTVKVRITEVSKLAPPDLSVYDPEPGPAMKPEDAFAQLRQMGKIR